MNYSVVIHDSNIFQNVSLHTINGVSNLTFVLQLLLHVQTTIPSNKHVISKTNGMILEIEKHAKLAYEHFERANRELLKQKSIIESFFEKQIAIESQLIRDIKQLETGIQTGLIEIEDKLQQINDAQFHLLVYQVDLKVADENARTAENELRQKEQESEIGIYAIPLLGHVLATLSGLKWQIMRARYRSNEATHTVHQYENAIKQLENDVTVLKESIEKIKLNKVLKEKELEKQLKEMENLKGMQNKIFMDMKNLRKWLNVASSTLAKTKILKDAATDFINLEILQGIITDIVNHLAKSSVDIEIDINTRLAIQELIDVAKKSNGLHYLWYSIPCLLLVYVYTTFYPVIRYFNCYRKHWPML